MDTLVKVQFYTRFHQVWPHAGSTFKKKVTLNSQNSRPVETDPCACILNKSKIYFSTKWCAYIFTNTDNNEISTSIIELSPRSRSNVCSTVFYIGGGWVLSELPT